MNKMQKWTIKWNKMKNPRQNENNEKWKWNIFMAPENPPVISEYTEERALPESRKIGFLCLIEAKRQKWGDAKMPFSHFTGQKNISLFSFSLFFILVGSFSFFHFISIFHFLIFPGHPPGRTPAPMSKKKAPDFYTDSDKGKYPFVWTASKI